jgi:hypothetical protein
MLDRLMPVVDEFAWRPASLPVEVDGGAEGEDAGGDAREQAFGAAGEVAFARPRREFPVKHLA